jgi:hypothetical protein
MDNKETERGVALPDNVSTKLNTLKNLHHQGSFCQEVSPDNLLTGEYQYRDNCFSVKGIQYKFLKRKNTSDKKTGLYIGAFKKGKYLGYVSSLYSDKNSSNVYRFDYKGVFYVLKIDGDRIKIYHTGLKNKTKKQT